MGVVVVVVPVAYYVLNIARTTATGFDQFYWVSKIKVKLHVPEWYGSHWPGLEFREVQDQRQRRIVETADVSFPGIQWAISGRSRAVPADEEAVEPVSRLQCSTPPHCGSHALSALYAAKTCQCLKTSLPPVVHNTKYDDQTVNSYEILHISTYQSRLQYINMMWNFYITISTAVGVSWKQLHNAVSHWGVIYH